MRAMVLKPQIIMNVMCTSGYPVKALHHCALEAMPVMQLQVLPDNVRIMFMIVDSRSAALQQFSDTSRMSTRLKVLSFWYDVGQNVAL